MKTRVASVKLLVLPEDVIIPFSTNDILELHGVNIFAEPKSELFYINNIFILSFYFYINQQSLVEHDDSVLRKK